MGATMQVTVNGEKRDISEGSTVRSLLDELGLEGPVAVERNQEVVPRARHREELLADQDVLEIVHFVGGG